jgi:hypothetical protein
LVGGEDGAAALLGEDGVVLAGPEVGGEALAAVAPEAGVDFETDVALIIGGGGLCTGGLAVTEAAFWTGAGF